VNTTQRQWPSGGFEIHERPWFDLAYLFFVFLPLSLWPDRPLSSVLASVLAIALFLPLFYSFYRGSTRPRSAVAHMLAVALIGYALIPFNPGGNTFLIYAGAMAASALSPRRAVQLSVVLLLVMALEFWWVMPTRAIALVSVAVVALIGGMVVAGIIFSRSRARANAELKLTQDEVRRLAGMAERERIGRDLHDLLGHTLSVVVLKSELAGKLLDRDPVAAREQIREVENVARKALAEVREAVAGIRATGLLAELASARLALLSADVRLDQRLPPLALDEKIEAVLAMAVREAVTNIIRHAGAQRVEIELIEDDSGLKLSIADDGSGGIVRHGNGLAGMKERLDSIRGTLEIESQTGAGTRLLLRVPNVPEGVWA